MMNEYIIEHVPVLTDYRHPTKPLTPKHEVKFYYHRKCTVYAIRERLQNKTRYKKLH